jgi:hypothetical protein
VACGHKFAQEFRFKTHLFLQNVYKIMHLIYIVTCLRNFAIVFIKVAAFIFRNQSGRFVFNLLDESTVLAVCYMIDYCVDLVFSFFRGPFDAVV